MAAHLLECIDCGRHHLPAEIDYLCPECSSAQKPMQPLAGLLRCVYEYDSIARFFEKDELAANEEQGLARWLRILPVTSPDSFPPLIESKTPLRAAERLRLELNLSDLWLKDDTVMPTASFKDRASAMVVAVARERDRETVATASTGNAATALAGQAASTGMQSVIFAPATAPAAKLAQIAAFGGQLFPIRGSYDEAFELSIEACREFGWYNRNTAYNPYTVEGKKTAALEIWEQLNYRAPDWIIVPTGDGVIAAGIEKGFSDLLAMKLIDRLPRLALVQAQGCQPIVRAFEAHSEHVSPERRPHTVADSISVGVPRAGRWAMKALASTRGAAVAVGDKEIISSISMLAGMSGVFAEPAAAASIAGLKKLVAHGVVRSDETIVALITGSGLKDVPAAMRSVKIPRPIKPSLDAVRRAMGV